MFLKESLEQSAIYFNSSVFSFLTIMIITIFFEFLFLMMSGILGIIIGHRSNNLKIVKSIVIGFAIYVILSSMTVFVLFMAGLFNSDIMSLFHNIEVSSNAMKNMMFVGIFLYAIYNLGIYFVGNRLFNKGVDVD